MGFWGFGVLGPDSGELSEELAEELSEELAEALSESEELAWLVDSVEVGPVGNCAFEFASAMFSPDIVNEDVKSDSLIK